MRLQYKTTTKYLFFSLPFYLMLFACGLQITDVEYALREAGENRGELEAVLSHYAKLDDRQKLEAAQYLIRYMPYHTSYDKGIEDYYHAIDSVVALSEDKLEQEKHIESLRLRFESKYKQKRDIEVITSEFLIQSNNGENANGPNIWISNNFVNIYYLINVLKGSRLPNGGMPITIFVKEILIWHICVTSINEIQFLQQQK